MMQNEVVYKDFETCAFKQGKYNSLTYHSTRCSSHCAAKLHSSVCIFNEVLIVV